MRVGTVAVLALTVLGRPAGAQQRARSPTREHPELAAIYAADQADRTPAALAGLSPAARDRAMRAVLARDTVRRARVEALMRAGAARTATDFFRAAVVVQHGRDTAASLAAHAWARRAATLDSTHAGAKRMVAASWDQYQYARGRPQWYGLIILGGLREPARLYTVDTTRVTDDDRRRLGIPSLRSQRALVDSLNARRRPSGARGARPGEQT